MPESFKLRPFRPLNEKVEERDFTEKTVFYDNDAAAAQARTRASLWTLHALLLLALAHASRHGGGGGARFYVGRWRWILVLGPAIGLTLGAKHSALPGLLGIGGVGFAAAVWSSGRDRWVRLARSRGQGELDFVASRRSLLHHLLLQHSMTLALVLIVAHTSPRISV